MELTHRRRLILILVATIACFAFSQASHASLINITIDPSTGLPVNDINFGLLPNNNPTSNFNALVTDIGLYETFAGVDLANAVLTGYADYSGSGAVNLTGYDYAVLHYGKGPSGAGKGGGIVFFDLNDMTGLFNFAANGSGPNGFGGLSSIRLFKSDGSVSVPDGGTTVMLLGLGLCGIGLLRMLIGPRATSQACCR